MENNKKETSSKSLALKIVIIMAVLFVILTVINSIGNIIPSGGEVKNTMPNYTQRELGDEYFYEPEWDADINDDTAYKNKITGIFFTVGAETFYLEDGTSDRDSYSAFFRSYFNILKKGDHEGFSELHTQSYLSENGEFEPFTAQRVYDINVILLSHTVIEDTSSDYYGYTRSLFDVSYMILRNDGTFRRDIASNESIPLIFELLDSGSGPKLNSIGHHIYYTEKDDNSRLVSSVIALAVGIIFIVCTAGEIITRKMNFLPIIISSFISFLASMFGAKWYITIASFVIISLLLYFVLIHLKGRKAQKKNDEDRDTGLDSDKQA